MAKLPVFARKNGGGPPCCGLAVRVQLAQEARPYALVSCVILMAVWGELRILRQLEASGERSSTGALGWVAYVFGTAAALIVQLS